jgi:MFS family permease
MAKVSVIFYASMWSAGAPTTALGGARSPSLRLSRLKQFGLQETVMHPLFLSCKQAISFLRGSCYRLRMMNTSQGGAVAGTRVGYNRFLLFVAGLGGLLYGVDVGIIASALPYLESTSGLNSGQLSFIVAAVLLGSVISTLFAGMLADLLGRKPMMLASGALFVISIPMIALAHGYGPLVLGRLLQGISAGLIGVVVPLYLAECLGAGNRGKGTGIFQWLLTAGIVMAALIGIYFSKRVDEVAKLGDAAKLLAFKDTAWRSIFWVSLPPGILFVLGGFFVTESPRWLFRRGQKEAARAALSRSRTDVQVETELKEMQQVAAVNVSTGDKVSSWPAIRPPASIPSSAITPRSCSRPAFPTCRRTRAI